MNNGINKIIIIMTAIIIIKINKINKQISMKTGKKKIKNKNEIKLNLIKIKKIKTAGRADIKSPAKAALAPTDEWRCLTAARAAWRPGN